MKMIFIGYFIAFHNAPFFPRFILFCLYRKPQPQKPRRPHTTGPKTHQPKLLLSNLKRIKNWYLENRLILDYTNFQILFETQNKIAPNPENYILEMGNNKIIIDAVHKCFRNLP